MAGSCRGVRVRVRVGGADSAGGVLGVVVDDYAAQMGAGHDWAPVRRWAVTADDGTLSEPIRSVAQKRRKAGELIGLPIGARPDYRYPLFQFDRARHQIHDLVKYANRRLAVAEDPYGAASWWLTATEILDGRSPLEDLEAGELTEIAIDNVLDVARRGM